MAAVSYDVGGELYSADQLVSMCAGNPDLFYQIFFPRTVRQQSAAFHLDLDQALEDPNKRLVHAQMFRGSAKTTRLRMYTARRIAYGLSKTILYVGATEGHALRSTKWIRRQIEVNKTFSTVFNLKPGSKWQEGELEILNTVTGETAWLMGAGYTGNLRGINFDDYRPDLIIVDDILTDENVITKEQREKLIDLIEGALRQSLAPATEDPNAKMAFLQTPLHPEDASAEASKDPLWNTISIPIWTDETLDYPIEQQESRWPVRYPSETVREEKRAAAARNRLSIWVREMEVRLTTVESRAFRPEWLQKVDIMPAHTMNILAIDPLPPPSERELAKGLAGKDFECQLVLGHSGGNYYVREYAINQGHEPNWSVAKFFELAGRWRVIKVVVSAVAYEKTLKWIFDQEMRRRGIYYTVELVTDHRPKAVKIVNTLSGLGSSGKLFCHPSHVDLIQQWNEYSTQRSIAHDDILDAYATGMSKLANPVLEVGADAYTASRLDGRRLKRIRLNGAP